MSGRRWLRTRPAALALLALAIAAPAARAATPAATAPTAAPAAAGTPAGAFTGYGPVPFGTSLARARALLPAARPIGADVFLGAPTIGGPHVDRLLLEQQSVAGLPQPINVELRFWKQQLWIVHLYLQDNPADAVRAMLVARLGPPTDERPRTLTWVTDATTTTWQVELRWVAITDHALSREAQAAFRDVLGGGARPSAPGASATSPAVTTPAPR